MRRERNVELGQKIRTLTDENLRRAEMLRRHEQRWQRVKDEYAKKKSQAGHTTADSGGASM